MAERSEDNGREAFKEKLRSIGFAFTHGKKDFHGPTVRERQERQLAEAATNPTLDVEKVSTRRELM